MQQKSPLKLVNVYIPFIEIYLQLEIEIEKKLGELAEIIHRVTQNDNELKIFRFKYNGELQSMDQQLKQIPDVLTGDPRKYLTAYAQMTGA